MRWSRCQEVGRTMSKNIPAPMAWYGASNLSIVERSMSRESDILYGVRGSAAAAVMGIG